MGGRDGMGTFVTQPEFEELNVGFALDEGCVSPTNYFPVFYGENICWRKLDMLENTSLKYIFI